MGVMHLQKAEPSSSVKVPSGHRIQFDIEVAFELEEYVFTGHLRHDVGEIPLIPSRYDPGGQ